MINHDFLKEEILRNTKKLEISKNFLFFDVLIC